MNDSLFKIRSSKYFMFPDNLTQFQVFGRTLIQYSRSDTFHMKNKKKVCKDQALKQSEPKSSPQNQNGKKTKITKSQNKKRTYRVSSYFQKGGHSAIKTELKIK